MTIEARAIRRVPRMKAGMIAPSNATAWGNGPSIPTAPTTWCEQLRHRVRTWTTRAVAFWFSLQITHFGGQYSIERLLALEEYTRNTSIYRVLLVLVVSPLPMITIVLCQESIPLQDPREGWSANYGFWVRLSIEAFVAGYNLASYAQLFIESFALSWRQMLVFCVTYAVCSTGSSMLVAASWTFPVPFITNLVLFNVANNTRYELPVLFVLPFLKILLKKLLASQMLDLEDTIPQETTFTIDFFDALYLATFMQTVSVKSVVVVMIVDVTQTVMELRELHLHTRGILERTDSAASIDVSNCGMLAAIRSLCKKIKPPEALGGIRVRSVVPHELSEEGGRILEMLEGNQRCSAGRTQDRRPVSSQSHLPRASRRCWKRSTQVVAVTQHQATISDRSVSMDERNTLGEIDSQAPHTRNLAIVSDALKVLFTAECLILAEYVEVVIPLLHAIFLLVMVHLPSAQYHTEMVGVTTDNVTNVVQNIFIYAALELVSMAALVFITWHSCGIQALYQLAFVLETQKKFVQCKLLMYLLLTLTARVAHFGTLFAEGSERAKMFC